MRNTDPTTETAKTTPVFVVKVRFLKLRAASRRHPKLIGLRIELDLNTHRFSAHKHQQRHKTLHPTMLIKAPKMPVTIKQNTMTATGCRAQTRPIAASARWKPLHAVYKIGTPGATGMCSATSSPECVLSEAIVFAHEIKGAERPQRIRKQQQQTDSVNELWSGRRRKQKCSASCLSVQISDCKTCKCPKFRNLHVHVLDLDGIIVACIECRQP
jgi:hypothetical protein